jgi:opacity protein-like surface antigen
MRIGSGWIGAGVACSLILAPIATAGVAQADEIKAGEIIVPEEAPPPPPPPMVQVEQEENWNRLGFYIGLGPSWFANEFEGDIGRLGGGDNAWGFHARAGYRFWDYVAVEGLYEYANDLGTDIGPLFPGDTEGNSFRLQTNVFTANLKLIAPFGRFQPYLGGGVGFMAPEQSREGVFRAFDWSTVAFTGRVMGGLDFYITPRLAIYADSSWVIPTDDLEDLEYVSVNLGGRFIF